jgi:hypothetical protein
MAVRHHVVRVDHLQVEPSNRKNAFVRKMYSARTASNVVFFQPVDGRVEADAVVVVDPRIVPVVRVQGLPQFSQRAVHHPGFRLFVLHPVEPFPQNAFIPSLSPHPWSE